jgi:hypothetical protein
MATSPDTDRVLAAAHAQVRAVDWSTWQVPPGDARVAEYLFADEPPLTNGLLAEYFTTCSWLWQRPIQNDEGQRVSAALNGLWLDHGLAQDYAPLFDVLSVVALPGALQGLDPAALEAVRTDLVAAVPDGSFPGVDCPVPGAEAAAAIERAKIPASTLASPESTGVALDGLYSATTFGLQLDIFGPPGSGTWGSTIEFYAFFPDGAYLYLPSQGSVEARMQDPAGYKAAGGQYEVKDATIRLYDAESGRTNTSDFTSTPDRHEVTFYGKTFTRIADASNLRKEAP